MSRREDINSESHTHPSRYSIDYNSPLSLHLNPRPPGPPPPQSKGRLWQAHDVELPFGLLLNGLLRVGRVLVAKGRHAGAVHHDKKTRQQLDRTRVPPRTSDRFSGQRVEASLGDCAILLDSTFETFSVLWRQANGRCFVHVNFYCGEYCTSIPSVTSKYAPPWRVAGKRDFSCIGQIQVRSK